MTSEPHHACSISVSRVIHPTQIWTQRNLFPQTNERKIETHLTATVDKHSFAAGASQFTQSLVGCQNLRYFDPFLRVRLFSFSGQQGDDFTPCKGYEQFLYLFPHSSPVLIQYFGVTHPIRLQPSQTLYENFSSLTLRRATTADPLRPAVGLLFTIRLPAIWIAPHHSALLSHYQASINPLHDHNNYAHSATPNNSITDDQQFHYFDTMTAATTTPPSTLDSLIWQASPSITPNFLSQSDSTLSHLFTPTIYSLPPLRRLRKRGCIQPISSTPAPLRTQIQVTHLFGPYIPFTTPLSISHADFPANSAPSQHRPNTQDFISSSSRTIPQPGSNPSQSSAICVLMPPFSSFRYDCPQNFNLCCHILSGSAYVGPYSHKRDPNTFFPHGETVIFENIHLNPHQSGSLSIDPSETITPSSRIHSSSSNTSADLSNSGIDFTQTRHTQHGLQIFSPLSSLEIPDLLNSNKPRQFSSIGSYPHSDNLSYCTFHTFESPCHILIISAQPLHEGCVYHYPFAAQSPDQLIDCFREYFEFCAVVDDPKINQLRLKYLTEISQPLNTHFDLNSTYPTSSELDSCQLVDNSVIVRESQSSSTRFIHSTAQTSHNISNAQPVIKTHPQQQSKYGVDVGDLPSQCSEASIGANSARTWAKFQQRQAADCRDSSHSPATTTAVGLNRSGCCDFISTYGSEDPIEQCLQSKDQQTRTHGEIITPMDFYERSKHHQHYDNIPDSLENANTFPKDLAIMLNQTQNSPQYRQPDSLSANSHLDNNLNKTRSTQRPFSSSGSYQHRK